MSKQPIAVNHKDYEAGLAKWSRCRDAIGGTDKIKAAREKYLPRLSAHKGLTGELKYEAYLKRALFYNASRRTRIGLSGAATLRDPKTITSGPIAEALAEKVENLLGKVIDEQLETSRVFILVNQDPGTDPYPVVWWAESIVNWAFTLREGEYVPSMVVLEEAEDVGYDNPYTKTSLLVRHGYFLMEGVCMYEKWAYNQDNDEWINIIPMTAVMAAGGRTIDFIPGILVGATTLNEPTIEDPVLLDLVDVNLSHYMNSADLEHGRHWTALPTAVAVGFPTIDSDGSPIEFNVGGESAWVTEQTGASASYLEFAGAGLGHLQTGMTEKQAMMAVLGARIIEEQKPSTEAAETIKTRLTGERSVLARIANTASRGLTWVFQTMLIFKVLSYQRTESTDQIDANTDYLNAGLSTSDLTALVDTLQKGAISFDTFFRQLERAEFYPAGRTLEEELALIDAGSPAQQAQQLPAFQDAPNPTDQPPVDSPPVNEPSMDQPDV